MFRKFRKFGTDFENLAPKPPKIHFLLHFQEINFGRVCCIMGQKIPMLCCWDPPKGRFPMNIADINAISKSIKGFESYLIVIWYKYNCERLEKTRWFDKSPLNKYGTIQSYQTKLRIGVMDAWIATIDQLWGGIRRCEHFLILKIKSWSFFWKNPYHP